MPSGTFAPTTTLKRTLKDSLGAITPPPSGLCTGSPALSAVAPVPIRKRTSFVPASNSAWSRSVGSVFVPAMPPGLETMLSDPGR